MCFVFFFQAEDGIRDGHVTGVQTCALPICLAGFEALAHADGARLRAPAPDRDRGRSEERRVGKECRSRWSPDHLKKKIILEEGLIYPNSVISTSILYFYGEC